MGFIKNISAGYGNYIKGKTIPQEQSRLKICNSCDFKKPNTDFWCMKCPCHMPSKVKAPEAACEIKKW